MSRRRGRDDVVLCEPSARRRLVDVGVVPEIAVGDEEPRGAEALLDRLIRRGDPEDEAGDAPDARFRVLHPDRPREAAVPIGRLFLAARVQRGRRSFERRIVVVWGVPTEHSRLQPIQCHLCFSAPFGDAAYRTPTRKYSRE